MFTIRQCQKCSKPLSPTSRSKGLCAVCYRDSRARKPILCAHCGQNFLPIRKGQANCSLSCADAARVTRVRNYTPPPSVLGKVWIPLTQGKFALIDEEDAPRARTCSWCAAKTRPNARGDVFYAKNTSGEYLHRFILGVTDPDTEVDHRNGDGLDCTRDNLRRTDRSGNGANRLVTVGKASGFKGVHITESGKWVVRYMRQGRELYGGTYEDKEIAAHAYDEIIRQYGDPLATFNFPKPGERSAITGEVIK